MMCRVWEKVHVFGIQNKHVHMYTRNKYQSAVYVYSTVAHSSCVWIVLVVLLPLYIGINRSYYCEANVEVSK